MGGYGSGRQGWRAAMESQRRIDVRDLRRRRLLTDGGAGVWRWSCEGEEMGSVSYSMAPNAMTLAYLANGEPYRVALPLTCIPCRYGGARHYFCCPRCAGRVEVVVMASARTWGCRRCLRLRYASQGLSFGDRCERRADKLRDRVGIDDGDYLHKRKWLRWHTFNRTRERANELQQFADGAFVARAAAMMGLKLPE